MPINRATSVRRRRTKKVRVSTDPVIAPARWEPSASAKATHGDDEQGTKCQQESGGEETLASRVVHLRGPCSWGWTDLALKAPAKACRWLVQRSALRREPGFQAIPTDQRTERAGGEVR
jgi:hypothetical protein